MLNLITEAIEKIAVKNDFDPVAYAKSPERARIHAEARAGKKPGGLFVNQAGRQEQVLKNVHHAVAPTTSKPAPEIQWKPEHGTPGVARAESTTGNTLKDKVKGVGAWIKKNPGKTGLIAGGLAGGAYLMNKKKQPQY